MARANVKRRGAQRGAALLALLAVFVLVFAYVVTSRLNAANRYTGLDREHNARVLAQAKRALIGYVAQEAAIGDNPGTTTEIEGRNPGSLPCPEAPGDFGTANEGRAAGNCTLPAVGRLPWRTLGLDKLVDGDGEPLWYVVSAGWALPNASAWTVINSESVGQLSLDGTSAVALIIAPGARLTALAGTGCTAWTQNRPAAGPVDLRNYLECENATSPANATFVSNRPGQAFNDQVVRVTAADLMPALEAAIAERAQREIAPALRNAAFVLDSNNPRRWVSSSSNPPIYPYPAPFADPTTSNYRGVSGTSQGHLPFAPSAGFVAYQATPANAVETLGNGTIESQTCSWEVANEVRLCQGKYKEPSPNPALQMRLEMTATFSNVAMGLRALDATRMTLQARDDGATPPPWVDATVSYRAEMNDGATAGKPHGSVTIRFWANLPNIDAEGWGTTADFRMRIERAVIADHCLLNATAGISCAGSDTSWFVRNLWHRNAYYAVAPDNVPTLLPAVSGCTSSNCLRFNETGTRNVRVLLVLTGRALPTQARPSASLANYLEYQNADLGNLYEQRPMRWTNAVITALNAPFNDRMILVDWIGSLSVPGQVASTTPLRVTTLP